MKNFWKLFIPLVLCFLIFYGCTKKETVKENKTEDISVADFSMLIDGCWVDVENAEGDLSYGAGYSFSFYTFANGKVQPAWYPGESGRSSTINSVTKNGNSYTLDVFYPETIELGGENKIPAEYGTIELTLENSNLRFSGESGTYIRIGDSFEEYLASEEIRKYKGETSPSTSYQHTPVQTPPQSAPVYNCAECGASCDPGHSYCSNHKCWAHGCVLQQKSMGVYCANHSCLLCTGQRTATSSYCSSHKCNRCENAVVSGSSYCVAHKCLLCNNQVSINSSYCSRHK